MTLPSTARVVIIGGGVVGVSALYHLAKAGWTDCVLLEKNELTAGSTWHAAGNVPTFSSSWSIMNMQRYSADLYRRLAGEVDYPMNYHVTGSLRLGHTPERLDEFRRVVGMGRRQDMGLELLTPGDLTGKYPFLSTHDLTGALYDPNDGDIDPAQLTQALAKGARSMGARIERFCPATGARREGDEWVIATPKGEIRCEFVVNAAGYYAREVAKWFGRDLPMVVMSHQYMLFDTIPELQAWSGEVGHKLPLLRDVDSSYYLRQEKFGFNLGPYERDCRAHWTTPEDPFPEDFSFQLYPDDLERLEFQITDAMARVPLLEQATLTKVINGPIPYTPDGNPLIGPMPGVPKAFEACVFTFGICQGGGAGKVLAEWITEGCTEWDMWSCDPRRFTGFEDEAYAIAKGKEIYANEYAVHFPHHVWPEGRLKKLSPVHDRVAALGAQFGPYNGWERALWYARPGDDTSEAAQRTWRREGPWAGAVREECEAVRDAAGILDLPGFSRFRLSGPGAADWLSRQITGKVPSIGRMGLGYFTDDAGRIVTEMSLARMAEDEILLITAATAELHDHEWLRTHLDPGLSLTNETDDWDTQILTGPAAREILRAAGAELDLTKGWLSHQTGRLAGREVWFARVSFAGELGWELHSRIADTTAVWDAVMAAGAPLGLRPFGMFALDALRIEKGYRAWKGDLSTDYSVLQAGLARFVDLSKPDFRGRDALLREQQDPRPTSFAVLRLDSPEVDATYMANLWHDGRIVGEITSSAWGHRVQACLGLGMLETALNQPGTALEVEIFDRRYPATVIGQAGLWDPTNQRLRA
ncbi:FAD-dependent oxidoreductase [Pararhodobacter sp. CCB-MM2]|uniref:GcvT family protein n=1 Tax=Pararhodobacter sp. CCB-MM2 TaxID=1786003 RepID=UPI00083764F0|nr:FAD-dependent oxidoreductase [Pararhodobacter sp. CCB-MM2]